MLEGGKPFSMSRRKLFLIFSLVVALALLVMQAASPAVTMDVSAGEQDASAGNPAAGASPAVQSEPITSPYHDEPASISGGGGMFLIK
jgi:hypothetical protein